jgi:hypothetical protein
MAKRKIKNTRSSGDTSRNRAKKTRKSLQRLGSKNGAWKGGKSAHAIRRKVRAKPGEVVHHKDHNKSNSKTSNLRKVSMAKHNKLHPEKGRKSGRVRRKR